VYRRFSDIPSWGGALSNRELLHDIVPFGFMLTIVSVLWTIVSYSDRVVLGFFLPPESANELMAVYSMAISLSLNVMVFPATVGGIFMPTISRLVGGRRYGEIRRTMATAQRWVLFITLPFVAVMIAFSREMLSVFYGSQYGGGSAVMAIFCIGLLFSAFSYVISLTLAGMRLVALEFKIALLVVALNVALCFLLIPPFGTDGAAVAAAASFAVSAALFVHYGKKMAGYSVPAEVYKICAAGVLTCALLFAMKPMAASAAAAMPQFGGPAMAPYTAKIAYLLLLGGVTALAAGAFAALSLFAKCFGREDISVMKQAAAKVRMPKGVLSVAERIILYGIPRGKG
jgi:O-antigen/teichoic acid export membrane protein